MVQQHKLKESDEQLHWFWRLTTKKWSLPIFYVMLVVLYLLITSIASFSLSPFKSLLAVLFQMPIGLSYYILFLIDLFIKQPLSPGFGFAFIPIIFIFDPLLIFSMIYIPFCKNKRNTIPKNLIIIIYSLIILSFFGIILRRFLSINFRGW